MGSAATSNRAEHSVLKWLADLVDSTRVVDYTLCDILGELAPVVRVLKLASGLGMAHEPEFDEGRRTTYIAKDGEPGSFEASVFLGQAPDQTILKVIAEEGIPRIMPVGLSMKPVAFYGGRPGGGWMVDESEGKGLDPLSRSVSVRIEVNAEKEVCLMAICDNGSILQRDEGVILACQNNAVTCAREVLLDAFGHIQSQVFFLKASSFVNGPWVFPSMSRIDHDGFYGAGF